VSNVKYPDSYVHGGPELTVVLSSIMDEGLTHMNKGEKANVYIPSRWLFFDFQPRVFHVDIVEVIKDLTVYQEALMYRYLRRLQTHRGAPVDTVKNVVSTIDNSEYNVMYHIMEKGTGEAITDGMNVETKKTISYMIQNEVVHQYAADQNYTWHTNSTGNMNTLTKTNCMAEIFTKMKKGGKVVVAMPSILFWDNDNLPVNNNGQFFIPKGSVVIFTITIT